MPHLDLRLALPLRFRGGFTLVEMLVVVSIMSIIAALAFGSLFSTVSHNRLLATEQLIADSVRQARHTARSTGQPAVLTITPVMDDSVPPKVVGGKIAGTSRICVWSETFDEAVLPTLGVAGDGTPLPAIQDHSTSDGAALVVGRTGKGMVANAFPNPQTVLAGRLISQDLEKPAQIVRGSRTDGFYLTCNVKPPSARTAGTIVIPLLMIGDTLDAANSQCGISLTSTVNNLTATIPQYSWEVDGWVTGASGAPVHLLSLDPTTRVVSVLPVPSTDIADPIPGGEWIEVGLLYTNSGGGSAGHLTIFVDGRPIAEIPQASALTAPPVPLTLRSGSTVHVGHATLDPLVIDQRSAAAIDDACLYRVGTDQVGNLPGGVIATGNNAQGAQIVAMPDGRVQVQRQGATSAGTAGVSAITFEELHAPQQTHVEIAIDARGVVSSKYVVPEAPP